MRARIGVAVIALLFLSGVHSEPSNEPANDKPSRPHRKVLVKRTPVSRAQGPASVAVGPAPGAEGVEQSPRLSRSAGDHRWQRFVAGEETSRNDYENEARPPPRANRFPDLPGGVFKLPSGPVKNTKFATLQLPDWAKGTVRLDVPVSGDMDGKLSPILVLPIPVPVKDNSRCDANLNKPDKYSPQGQDETQPSYEPTISSRRGETRRPRPPPPAPAPAAYDEDYDEPAPARPMPSRPYRPQPTTQRDPFYGYQETYSVPPPTAGVSSRLLIEQFRAQQPNAPHLPPVLIRDRRYGGEEPSRPIPQPLPAQLPAPTVPVGFTPQSSHSAPKPGVFSGAPYIPPPSRPTGGTDLQKPPQPRFDRPLMMRGEVTVHRADYTEPYTAWWDATSGAATMQLHGGSTSTYRMVSGGGRIKRAVANLDRSGEQNVVRCTVMPQSTLTPADQIPPVLPDTREFSFSGFVQYGEVKAEMWKQILSGNPGEMGGARGEALTYRHELLLARSANNSAMPLQYSVAVDSSVLGPDCDGYVHRYHEVREEHRDPQQFQIDLDKACDTTEETDDMSKVEPLREFTMLQRHPRYDELFKGYTQEFDRKYSDSAEEAVRKNLFMQTSRFISSGNRLGATFQMAVNFLSDRLDAELQALLGVVLDDEHFPAEAFPHARAQLRDIEGKLPKEFDWRERGGVTPVRYQGSCSSCWAFAVTGAVEGALFRRTRRLVPLSEQCLVDCAQPYGGRGCGGTWPSHAYDYVQDRGLPALDEYTPYQAKVQQCQDKRVPPVTHISAHVNVTQFSVPALKVAIRRHAPSVVIIDANLKSFQTYKSGVFYDDRCAKAKNKLKHAVLAVGWGEQKNEPHFILKNSWSAAWGDGGYIRLHGPSNTCGVLTLPSYPRLETDDVVKLPGARASAPVPAPAARIAATASAEDYD